MKLITCILMMFTALAIADDQKEAIATAKKHMAALVTADTKVLKTTMAESIQLMPGHEFTKEEYKLADEDGRKTGAVVKRDDLLRELLKKLGDRPKPSEERVLAKLARLEFAVIASKVGAIAADPADAVQTVDDKLHFNLLEGDLLIKGAPDKGDFVLFQLRKMGKDWKVVAEYLD